VVVEANAFHDPLACMTSGFGGLSLESSHLLALFLILPEFPPLFPILPLPFSLTGVLIVVQLPRLLTGWIACLVLLEWGVFFVPDPPFVFALIRPLSLPPPLPQFMFLPYGLSHPWFQAALVSGFVCWVYHYKVPNALGYNKANTFFSLAMLCCKVQFSRSQRRSISLVNKG